MQRLCRVGPKQAQILKENKESLVLELFYRTLVCMYYIKASVLLSSLETAHVIAWYDFPSSRYKDNHFLIGDFMAWRASIPIMPALLVNFRSTSRDVRAFSQKTEKQAWNLNATNCKYCDCCFCVWWQNSITNISVDYKENWTCHAPWAFVNVELSSQSTHHHCAMWISTFPRVDFVFE